MSIELPFDATKIKWWKKTNQKGEFEYSEDFNSLDHKALLKFLKELAGGSVSSGEYFYWVYQNGSTIGRKLKKRLNNTKNISSSRDKMSEEQGSMVDKDEYQQKPPQPQRTPELGANNKLFLILEDIAKAMRENTAAVNALLTAAFMNKQPPSSIPTPRPPVIPPITPPLPTHQTPPAGNPFDRVKTALPQTVIDKLDFSIANGQIILKPKEFLGSDTFAKLASVVRELGGEYVSAGKGSHFRVASQ